MTWSTDEQHAARRAAHRLPAPVRRAVLKRDGRQCQLRYPDICTGRATDVDHINGLEDTRMVALQAACSPCNQHKNILTRPKLASRRRPAEPHPGLRHAP